MTYPQSPPPGPPVYGPPPADPTAVLGRRIAAYAIDVVLALVVWVVAFAAVAERIEGAGAIPGDACDLVADDDGLRQCIDLGDDVYLVEGSDNLVVAALGIGFAFANLVLLQTVTGASIGKLLLGLRVVDARGQVAGFGRMLVRWLLLFVDAFFCFLVGLITAAVSKGHRRVGDMVAGTYVVAAASVGAPPVAAAADSGRWTPPPAAGGPPPPGGWTPPPGPPG